MILKINDEFINVEDVFVERQSKIFEKISQTAGDFSYEFEIDNTKENLVKLGLYSPVNQVNKPIYTINNTILYNNSGDQLFQGYLQVSSRPTKGKIKASFFSGNNNWFNMMTGDLEDLDLSEYEVEMSGFYITDSWTNTEGVIFPYVNAGVLGTRSHTNFVGEDYPPFIYVKDVISKCFQQAGLKLQGEILSDWRYNHLITSNNNIDIGNDRIVKVSKVIDQSIDNVAYETVEYEVEETVGDFSNWDNVNFRYVADVPMIVEVTVVQVNTGAVGAQGLNTRLIKNGVDVIGSFSRGNNDTFTKKFPFIQGGVITPIQLDAGDYLEVESKSVTTPNNVITSGSFEIIPIKILKVNPSRILPEISQLDFCLDVFKIFNTVIDFDPFSKTVTVDFFKSIVRRPEIDISEFIDPDTIEDDYIDLISEYANINNLTYAESGVDIAEKYNDGRVYKYGSGQITSDNDFVEKTKDILQSTFVASAEDSINPMGMSMVKLDFAEIESGQEYTAAVTNNSGIARITVSETFTPTSGELVEIYDSSASDTYLGQWMINTVVSVTVFECYSLPYDVNSNIRLRRIKVVPKKSDQVLLLVLAGISMFGGTSAYAYFHKPEISNPVGTAANDYDSGLSFGEIDSVLQYQRTMIEDYWQDVELILQDPIKITVDAYLPKSVYLSLKFSQPVRIKTSEFNSRFLLNKDTGYINQSTPCTLELIKIPT